MDQNIKQRWLEALDNGRSGGRLDLAAAGYGQPVVHTVIRHIMEETDGAEDSS